MEIEVIRVYRDGRVFELDDDLHAFAFGAGGEIQQGMLVEAQLSQDAIEAGGCGFGHVGIVRQPAGRRALLVAQRFDGIQTGGLDGREHAADDSYEA